MMILKKRTSQILVLLFAVAAGVLTGSLLKLSHPEWTFWENTTFLQGMGLAEDAQGTLLYYILTPFFWLALLGLLGLSAVGLVAAPCVLFLRGTALGAILESIYICNGISGLYIALVFVMPYAFSATMLMTLGARETFRFSVQIAGLMCEKTQEHPISVQLYAVRFLVLFVMLAGLGFLQSFWMQYGYPALAGSIFCNAGQ